ncbi:MAG: hypothetical protein Kow0032_18970 [Methyloligellaceae bacterium]
MAELYTALAGAVVGAFATVAIRRRFEKVQTTIAQFRAYHSPDMAEARNIAWRFLKVKYPKQNKPFHMLWSDKKGANHEDYVALVKVIYFWFLLDSLKQQRELLPALAHKMLAYQFGHWKEALQPLYDATTADGRDLPEWIVIMEPDRMGWLDPERPHRVWI